MSNQQRTFIFLLSVVTVFVGIYSFTFGEYSLFRSVPRITQADSLQTSDESAQQGNDTEYMNSEVNAMQGSENSVSEFVSSFVTSIKAEYGDSVACSFDDGTSQAHLYILGDSVKLMRISESKDVTNGTALLVNSTVYLWEEGSQTGFRYRMNDNGSSVNSILDSMVPYVLGDIDLDVETLSQHCTSTAVSESEFSLPQDIAFEEFDLSILDELTSLGSFDGLFGL